MKLTYSALIASVPLTFAFAGCQSRGAAEGQIETAHTALGNPPATEEPCTRHEREIQRLSRALAERDAELGRWKRATVTVYGFDDGNFNKLPGDNGVWSFSGSGTGEIIRVPFLKSTRSDKGKHGNDQWSSIKVTLTVPEK